MGDSATNDDLPDAVLKVLQRLERVTGRIPVARAMAAIVMGGLTLTAGILSLIWWADQHRSQQAFEATAARLQILMQDRLDQRAALLHHLATWASDRGQVASGQPDWRSGGWAVIGTHAGQDASRLGLSKAQQSALQSCLGAKVVVQGPRLCRLAASPGVAQQWLLAEPVARPGAGWVLAQLTQADLTATLDDGVYWHTHANLMASGGAQWAVRPYQGGGAREVLGRVRLVTTELPVALTGRPVESSLLDSWSRHTGMWVAGGAGVVFTLLGVHVYLMLISTRRRARDMAREMSSALHLTQSRNQAVMDTAPDAIIMTDGQGKVRWCNQATTSLFGREQQGLAGHDIGEILPVLSHDAIDEWFATRGFSNRVIGFEAMGVRAEGTAFPVAMSARRVELDGELIQTFIVRDTTDAKWAEQELSLRDRALASSADGVVITSMTLPNQPIIYVNRAFEKITGYEADEVLGSNCKFLLGEDLTQSGSAVIREAIRQGRSCQVVLRNYRKGGELFYNQLAISPVLSPEGVLTHYVGVQNDITDRIAAEAALSVRTERLNAVFDLSPDGFVVFDRRGEVSIVNPAFERMTGLLAGDLVGRSLSAFEEALMARCKSVELSDRSVATVIASQDSEMDGTLPSARELLHLHTPTVRTLVRRVRQGAQDNETVMYFRDITHELEVDRMKSEFLAMAAHELRTPMVSIFGFTELLLKRTFTDERRQDMLGTIHKQASILINLVNELLDLARIEARRGKDFNLRPQLIGPIIEQALAGLKVPGDRRKVRVSVEAEDVQVSADMDKLGQAVLNVLSNAYKYSPKGGEILLRVYCPADDAQLVIEVQDQGIGMSPDQLARVFERFFRADPSGNIPGTGLGMSLVKEIVSLHQGEVEVISALNEGTTVRITLPAIHPPESRGMHADTKEITG